MTKKHFYSHLVELDSLTIELETMMLSEDEKKHLLQLAESSLHHAILDAIMSELTEEDKKKFLMHLSSDKHDKVWLHLNNKIENIEEKIKKTADELKEELHKDIIALKKSSPK